MLNNHDFIHNQLRKTVIKNHHKTAVDARRLWHVLHIKTEFMKWFRRTIKRYNFNQGTDYIPMNISDRRKLRSHYGAIPNDYVLTLECAEEISMIQRNRIGRLCRKYYLGCLNHNQLPNLSTLHGQLRLVNELQDTLTFKIKARPKIRAWERFCNSKGYVETSVIAQMYKISARKLNSILHQDGIIYRNNNTWELYQHYKQRGYGKQILIPKNGLPVWDFMWTLHGANFVSMVLNKLGYSRLTNNKY